VAIDSSGMLQSADGEPVHAVGDEFVVHMDRESLNDYPLGKYDVTVIITKFDQDKHIEWTISGVIQPPIKHLYGYRLEPSETGTLVTSYYDWSQIDEQYRGAGIFPGDPRGRPARHPRHPRPHRRITPTQLRPSRRSIQPARSRSLSGSTRLFGARHISSSAQCCGMQSRGRGKADNCPRFLS